MRNYKHNLFLLCNILKIVYPRYNPNVFLLYMIKHYYGVEKLKKMFNVVPISNRKLFNNIIHNCSVFDVNNSIIVSEEWFQGNNVATITVKKHDIPPITRKVHVIRNPIAKSGCVLLNCNLFFNLKKPDECCLKEFSRSNFDFADEIELALVNTPHDWGHYIIDEVLKKYFSTPKIVYNGDIIAINLKDYGSELFYSSNKIININENINFKCKRVVFDGEVVNGGYYCVYGKTTLKQSANVRSFIQPTFFSKGDSNLNISMCPYGLETYFTELLNSVSPFIEMKKNLNLMPAFLLVGRKGSGKHLLIECLNSYFGMHLYTVNNFDLTANVYAQNETKVRNVCFAAKMSAPCILEIKNFENFGKNNEGQYDERLISHFITEVENLLKNNKFPVILFCVSNDKHLPIELRRLFLKIFEIGAPNEQNRELLLKWVLQIQGVKTECNLGEIANKTHGFVFEDFKTLVHYARINNEDSLRLEEQHFLDALSLMQSSYSESLGAPKVPKVLWSDVGGLEHVKEEIIKTIKLPLRHPEVLKSTGLKRSGILLFGPPGTGKTLIAKAAATECGLCFLSVKGPELLNMYVGQSEQNVREVFEKAREASPCIIFFDELDALAPNRGASGDSGGVMDRVVSQLLAEMDGLNDTGTVFIIGATNRPDLIDSALLRPGRFDKLLYIGPCTDKVSKIAVLRALTKKFNLGGELILESVVDMCSENFSGADFYGLCSTAWLFAVRKLIKQIENGSIKGEPRLEDVIVSLEDFQLAIKDIKPSITKEDIDYFNKLKSEIT